MFDNIMYFIEPGVWCVGISRMHVLYHKIQDQTYITQYVLRDWHAASEIAVRGERSKTSDGSIISSPNPGIQ